MSGNHSDGDTSEPREPLPVEIPMDDHVELIENSSRKSSLASSASTSSFEDVDIASKFKATTPERSRPGSTTSARSNRSLHSRHSVRTPGPLSAATIDVEDVKSDNSNVYVISATTSMASIPARKGPLAFKKTSFDAFSPPEQTDVSLPVMTAPKPNSKDVKEKKKRRISSELRDPENVNDIVKIEFNDIFAEPEGTYSFGTIWGASNNLFTDTKVWCYKFLSALLAVPCSICWGVNFACLSFCQIWLCEPGIRCGTIHCRPWSRIFGLLVRSFVEPTFAAVGKIFGNIRVTTSKE